MSQPPPLPSIVTKPAPSGPDSGPAIEVSNLFKIYGAKQAVAGLSLSVPRGCFFGFLGPNGAGKTTTIRMMMGLAPPTAGSIKILGHQLPEAGLLREPFIEVRRGIDDNRAAHLVMADTAQLGAENFVLARLRRRQIDPADSR